MTGASDIKAADIDRDNDLDVVAIGNSQIRVYKNANNVFTSFQTITIGTGGNSIDLADFDGDNDIDLVANTSSSGSAARWINTGSGSFGSQLTLTGTRVYTGVVAKDFDGLIRQTLGSAAPL